MKETRQPNENEPIDAPRELIDALADLHNERIFIPPSVDESIMAEARKHLGPAPARKKPSNIIAWSGWGVALAASVVLVASLALRSRQSLENVQSESTPAPAAQIASASPVFKREDINQDQSVDILDAFALARRLEGGGAIQTKMDFNNDGVIDKSDVDWIARASVKIEKGI